MIAPADEYRSRVARHRTTHDRLSTLDARYSYVRLTVFAVGACLAVAATGGWLSPWWIVWPVAAFGILVVRHDRILQAKDMAARAMAFYERGLARIEDRWAGMGDPGERFRDPDHLYAQDLDLFGPASLFELLSIARTRAGEATLASWLLNPADATEIRERTQAVTDLTPRLDLREALSHGGAAVSANVHAAHVIAWAEAPPLFERVWLRPVAALLSATAVVTAAYGIASGNSSPFWAVVALEILFSFPLKKRAVLALHRADGPARELQILSFVLARLEREQFEAERLRRLQRELADASSMTASAAISQLRRLVELHEWQHNLVFAPLAASLLWGTQLAFAVEAWRRRHGRDVRAWLRISGEFEALASLSAYCYEHPHDTFPEIVEPIEGRGQFQGTALGHPLLPADRMVRNDVTLDHASRLLVVSGSNMSGKSTLLRTVGINAVLALAGAPVRATHLRLTPLRVGATLRIQDSLREGRSRFYAEITRLRDLVDLASGSWPVLFLLDELFHGTNSGDRIIGASAVLRTLIDRGAIGLVTTHDLAVTRVADEIGSRAVNVHFEDDFDHGQIHFDFVMKPGPVTRSNALALMRAVGLDVDPA